MLPHIDELGFKEIPLTEDFDLKDIEIQPWESKPTKIQCGGKNINTGLECGNTEFEVAYTGSYETSIRCKNPFCMNYCKWATVHTG